MNTKKASIGKAAGLVIGTCLVCMLCVGCASAGDTSVLYPFNTTMYYYENVEGTSGSYTYLNNVLVLTGMEVIRSESLYPEGKYTSGTEGFLLKKMDAVITTIVYDASGNEIIASSDTTVDIPAGSPVKFEITPTVPSKYSLYGYIGLKFLPPGATSDPTTFLGTTDYTAGSTALLTPTTLDPKLEKGTWTVWAYFVPVGTPGYFSASTPESYLNGKKYTFNIVSSNVRLSVDPETVKVGEDFILTLTGKPNDQYYLKSTTLDTKFKVADGQSGKYDPATQLVTIGQSGSTSLRLTALDSGSIRILICDKTDHSVVEDDVDVTIGKAQITVASELSSYVMGEDIKLSGTNEANADLYYYIEGMNRPAFTQIAPSNLKFTNEGKTWETTIKGSYISALDLDTGSYTFYVSSINSNDRDTVVNAKSGSTASIGIRLVQPSISLYSTPDVVVQGNDLVVKGTADGSPSSVQWYLFGNNKFYYSSTEVGKSGSFVIEMTIDKNSYDPGQYYLVVQHPMYDKVFNVGAEGTLIYQNNKGSFTDTDGRFVLFNVGERQSGNAAYALCEAINSENIDDLAVKRSFIVSSSKTTVDPIPSQIAKGLPFTVSGTSNDADANTVSVELLSTRFTPESKQQATSASYVTLITTPDENGRWAVTFDTTGMNIDTYSINVVVGSTQVESAKITIVAPVATTVPTQSTPIPTASTAKPTESPKSPAPILGILAGIAAIVCLKRRNA